MRAPDRFSFVDIISHMIRCTHEELLLELLELLDELDDDELLLEEEDELDEDELLLELLELLLEDDDDLQIDTHVSTSTSITHETKRRKQLQTST